MTRRTVLAAVAVGVSVLAAVAFVPVIFLSSFSGGDSTAAAQCPALAPSPVTVSNTQLTAAQLTVAETIIGVNDALGLGQPGAIIGLITGLQESGLTNLDHGDRDSLGVFQQRPSQGWGTPAQIEDVTYAAEAFYDGAQVTPGHDNGLEQIAGWQQMAPTDAAQAVQRSAFPDAYAKWVPLATQLAAGATITGGQLAVDNCQQPGTVNLPANLPAAVTAAIEDSPTAVQAAISFALAQIGKPYLWGGVGPNSYDCSGLIQTAYAAAGISIPRTSQAQWAALGAVSGTIAPGDLIFYEGAPPGHVVMAIGAGWMIEAPHTGAVVHVGPIYAGNIGVARVIAQ